MQRSMIAAVLACSVVTGSRHSSVEPQSEVCPPALRLELQDVTPADPTTRVDILNASHSIAPEEENGPQKVARRGVVAIIVSSCRP